MFTASMWRWNKTANQNLSLRETGRKLNLDKPGLKKTLLKNFKEQKHVIIIKYTFY